MRNIVNLFFIGFIAILAAPGLRANPPSSQDLHANQIGNPPQREVSSESDHQQTPEFAGTDAKHHLAGGRQRVAKRARLSAPKPREKEPETKTKEPSNIPPLAINILISVAGGVVPFLGLGAPLLHGLVIYLYGEIADVSYPHWFLGSLAGYATYAVGFILTIGLAATAGALIGTQKVSDEEKSARAFVAGYGIGVMGWVGTFMLATPVITWAVGTLGSHPNSEGEDEQNRRRADQASDIPLATRVATAARTQNGGKFRRLVVAGGAPQGHP